MIIMKILSTFFTLSLFFSPFIQAASFNCQKASNQIERMICNDAELSKLDNELASTYFQYLDDSDDIMDAIEFQKNWLKTSRDTCQNIGCLKSVYQSRVHDIQEGIRSKKLTEEDIESDAMDSITFGYRCDRHNLRLEIADARLFTYISSDIKSKVTELAIDESSMIKFAGTEEHPLILPNKSFIAKCQIGKVTYILEARAVIFGSNPYGRDGARPTSISVSVRRNSQPVVSNLDFEGSGYEKIHRITFSEATGNFNVLASQVNPVEKLIERQFKIKSLPENLYQEIFKIPE